MKLLLLGAAAALGYFVYNKAMNVNTFSKAFDYDFAVKNFRFHTWNEIRFNLDINILNPSNLGLIITNPLLQVYYNNTQLTRSTYNIPKIEIKANGHSLIKDIEFKINLLSNWFTIKSMLGALLKGVTLSNLSSAKEILERNQEAFFKLLRVQFTGQLNGTPFTKSFNLG